jgi:hypothetical protein
MDEAARRDSCPEGASDAGCYICTHDGKAAPSTAGVHSAYTDADHRNTVYHHKAIQQYMYQFGLTSVLDVGCGIAPSFIIQLRTEIPCFDYAGTESSKSKNELRIFQNMFQEAYTKAFRVSGSTSHQDMKLPSWAKFEAAEPTERSDSALLTNYDLLYYHRPMDMDSPEMHARVIGSICRAKPKYMLLKNGSRRNILTREPDAYLRDRNLRGLDRFFLLYNTEKLCFSRELGKYLRDIPRGQSGPSKLIGLYDDANHPGLKRRVSPTAVADVLLVSGLDGGGWSLPGWLSSPSSGTITVDFSSKGGPSRLTGVWDEQKGGIKWSDGNFWLK